MSIDEQTVRKWLAKVQGMAHPQAGEALALIDAKDAEIAELKSRLEGMRDNYQAAEDDVDAVTAQRDEALSKLERAEQALAELTEQVNEASRATLSYGNQCATAVTKARDLEQALAERDAAIVEAVRRADASKFSTCIYAVEPLRPFLKPVEPEPDPLVAIFTEIARGPNRPANEEEEAAAFRQALARSGYEVRKVGDGK